MNENSFRNIYEFNLSPIIARLIQVELHLQNAKQSMWKMIINSAVKLQEKLMMTNIMNMTQYLQPR